MKHLILVIVGTAILAVSIAQGAEGVQDDALQQLQRSFENLHFSLQSKGGISSQDLPVIERLRHQFAAYNAVNTNEQAIAAELQLSIWLEDHDRVDVLFEQLFSLAPEQLDFAHAWAAYFAQLGEHERADAIYDRVLRMSPDATDIRVSRARRLRQQNQYPRALEVLEALSPDALQDPEVMLLRSDLLFAENRFEESLALLKAIPEEALQLQPTLARQRDSALPVREEYVELWARELAAREADANANLPQVEIIVEERGRIVLELFEDNAPNTIANFITLAEAGFYDGTTFHRVIANFMAQGGDPNTKPDGTGTPGMGGPGYAIADEWQRDDARKHFAGTLAMANSGPNTAGSQFYITHLPTAHLNQGYTVFGRVLEGLDVVRAIQPDDRMEAVRVLRKRDHAYEVEHFTGENQPSDSGIPDSLRDVIREHLQERSGSASE